MMTPKNIIVKGGLGYGLYGGQDSLLIKSLQLLSSHSCIAFAPWAGTLSCWNIHAGHFPANFDNPHLRKCCNSFKKHF